MIKFANIIDPFLQLENNNRVFTSLEGENPGGSIKDHMVKGELEDLIKENIIKKDDTISEVSSGSTALSLAYHCKVLGLKCILFLPETASWHLLADLQKLKAEVQTYEAKSIYAFYDSFSSRNPSVYRFNQLFDERKKRHYENFGSQILNHLGPMDAIIGGIGTGHSLLGTARGLNTPLIISAEPDPSMQIVGVRNIEHERYGRLDACTPNLFHQRIIISQKSEFDLSPILTDYGAIEAPASFQLVMAAVKVFLLKGHKNLKIFALGASLKRDRSVLRKAI
ncbi:MAG: pyridoxal-phosphate dependent enzyme [Pseudobdellovibrionaceae bacterium]